MTGRFQISLRGLLVIPLIVLVLCHVLAGENKYTYRKRICNGIEVRAMWSKRFGQEERLEYIVLCVSPGPLDVVASRFVDSGVDKRGLLLHPAGIFVNGVKQESVGMDRVWVITSTQPLVVNSVPNTANVFMSAEEFAEIENTPLWKQVLEQIDRTRKRTS
jgi:hypothetical protein